MCHLVYLLQLILTITLFNGQIGQINLFHFLTLVAARSLTAIELFAVVGKGCYGIFRVKMTFFITTEPLVELSPVEIAQVF